MTICIALAIGAGKSRAGRRCADGGRTAEDEQTAAAGAAQPPAIAAMPARHRDADRTSGPILQANGLTKRYGGLVANSDIDFTVNHGELRGIIGPNGAGKIHLLQDADLRSAADRPARSCSRAATSPA